MLTFLSTIKQIPTSTCLFIVTVLLKIRMGIFCYTVYSECIVLCLWKLCFKLYFHMFCLGQSTLSLKATEVLELKATWIKILSRKAAYKCKWNHILNKLSLTQNKHGSWFSLASNHEKPVSSSPQKPPPQCLVLP